MTAVAIDRTDRRDTESSSSASKALAVLEIVISADGCALGVSDVALASGMPTSTAHRLLSVLRERGFVDRVGSKYRVGGRFFELSEHSRRSGHGDLCEIAAPTLEALFDEVGATVLLGVLDGPDVLYVEKITGPGGCRHGSRPGGRTPATTSALGKAMLAFSAAALIDECLRVPMRRETPYTITVPQVLRNQLADTRASGVAFELEESRLGFAAVAAPILVRGRGAAAVAVLTRTGATTTVERFAAPVLAAARRIARDMSAYDATWRA